MNIRVMSFNTQHCLNYKTQQIDFKIMADAIKELGGEIVGLQEMRSKGADPEYTDQLKALSSLTGYDYYYFAKAIDVDGENPYGNGILSKYPIVSAENVIIPNPTPDKCETRCVLKAVIYAGSPLTVLVTHFGFSDEEHENAVDTVLNHITQERCVLMGDFNMKPDNNALSRIRECMRDSAEFFDTPKLSFPSDFPTRKIDYLFLSRDINLSFADIPAVVASDHRPYICDIEI